MQSLPDPLEPTTTNINRVKINLTNLQKFNDIFYTYSISKCANAFLLLGKNDANDPGMQVGINLLCGAIIGMGGDYGILGCVIANYFCGLISQYSSIQPPALLTAFASYITRIQATTIQADHDMAIDYTNATTIWYVVKSGSFDTPWGERTLGCCLGQLATVDIPAETDPLFDELIFKTLYAFDQTLWWTILRQNFQINEWLTNQPPEYLVSKYSQDWINNYCKTLIIKNPAINSNWEIIQIRNFAGIGKKKSYYMVNESSLGSPPNKGNDQPISDGAAKYLFIDSIPGDIINNSGLFTREYIFNSAGIKNCKQII